MIQRKRSLGLMVIFFGLIANAQSQKFISVNGKEIIGIDDKPLLIKGVNLGNWLVPEGYMFKFTQASSPRLINGMITELIGPSAAKDFWIKYLDTYITEGDVHFLKISGANSIRLPFNYKLFTNEDYLANNDSLRGFKYIDKIINLCKKQGLYVLLDMHCAPGGQTGDNIDDSYGYPFLFQDVNNQQLTINIWKRIAEKYKDEPTILGYDLLNEPIAHFFDAATLNPLLEPLFKRITAAIRQVDKQHLVFLEGSQWASNFKSFSKPFDDKLVYSFHKYWTDTTQKVIQDYVAFRDKYNVPIYMGESGENNNTWINSFRKLLEKNNIGWHFWPYKKMESSSSPITFNQPNNYQLIIDYSKKIRTSFDDIRKAKPANTTEIISTLNNVLHNALFENCTINKSYLKALGLNELAL